MSCLTGEPPAPARRRTWDLNERQPEVGGDGYALKLWQPSDGQAWQHETAGPASKQVGKQAGRQASQQAIHTVSTAGRVPSVTAFQWTPRGSPRQA